MQIIEEQPVVAQQTSKNFIEANTQKVALNHLKNECIIPVFSKDNESTISHYQFIQKAEQVVQDIFPEHHIDKPDIRVSHIIKGRIPSAIGKPARELKEHEKTIYYERCAFVIKIPDITETINGNRLSLTVGGVRAYNQENLYSKKTVEKFKVFIGFKNWVCTNLCISTDGFSNEIRVTSVPELKNAIIELLSTYDKEKHIADMHNMFNYTLTEKQFAHFIGKCRMYQHLEKDKRKKLFPMTFNDGQLNQVVKGYYTDPAFGKERDGTLNLWNLYHLFTQANKSSYIDANLERNVNAHELIRYLGKSVDKGTQNWFLHNQYNS